MTKTESSQYTSLRSCLPPPQYENPESCLGSFINLVTSCGLRVKGFLCQLLSRDLKQGLQNVKRYWKKGRNDDGFQIPPSSDFVSKVPTDDALELFPPQSLFSTFPPNPVSLPQIYQGFDSEALSKDFKQYELWGGPQEINNNQRDTNTIDESSYMISRNPFGPIGRPCNPIGPIQQPLRLPSSYELRHLGFV